MTDRTCFFIGHRDAPEEVLPALRAAVEQHIAALGVTVFLVGRYGRFDALAARAVREARAACPGVRLLEVLPYHPSVRPPSAEGFDGSCYPPGLEHTPKRLAIVQANRYMVDHCEFLIAYAWQPGGNAGALVRYAERRARAGLLGITRLPRCGPDLIPRLGR